MRKINLTLSAIIVFISFGFQDIQKQTDELQFQNIEMDLLGSTWRYEDEDLVYEITFREDGKLETTHPHDVTPDNDAWVQMAQQIVFTYNNEFSIYEGKLVNENLMVGSAKNKNFSWTWKAYRVESGENEMELITRL